MQATTVLTILAAAVLVVGCPSGGGGGGRTVRCSNPGDVDVCFCAGGAKGEKTCQDDKQWSKCQCAEAPADALDGTADTTQPEEDAPPADTSADHSGARCEPKCEAGWACGSDGCGGTCGTCPGEQLCKESTHTCVFECVPSCGPGGQCGSDGCGGTCGTCPGGTTCNEETHECIPGCTAKCEAGWECGPDGCGGTCGTCPGGAPCNSAHMCEVVTGDPCQTTADCPPATACMIAIGDPATGWTMTCEKPSAGASEMGGPCDGKDTDCQTGVCLVIGECSAVCKGDAGCTDGGSSFLCDYVETGADTDGDGDVDKVLSLGLCIEYPGTKAPGCENDGDCSSGVCTYRSLLNASGKPDAGSLCVSPKAGDAYANASCGGSTGTVCASGYCLGADESSPGFCGQACFGHADCPQGTTVGPLDGTHDMYCRSLVLNYGGDPADPSGFAIGTFCWPVTEGGSMSDCSANLTCPDGEGCVVFGLAKGVYGKTKKDYVCLPAKTADGVPYDAEVGADCDPDVGPYCKDLYCLPNEGGDGSYCSKLCKVAADCPGGMTCKEEVILQRKSASNTLKQGFCAF